MTQNGGVTIRLTRINFVCDLVYTYAVLTAQSWRIPTKSEAPNDSNGVDNGDDKGLSGVCGSEEDLSVLREPPHLSIEFCCCGQ